MSNLPTKWRCSRRRGAVGKSLQMFPTRKPLLELDERLGAIAGVLPLPHLATSPIISQQGANTLWQVCGDTGKRGQTLTG